MATLEPETYRRPIAIAPLPRGTGASRSSSPAPLQTQMSFSCQPCAKRKVKCDKTTPACSSCRKTKLECVYQAPAQPRRKRKLSIVVHDKIALYERILRQHDLMPQDTDISPFADEEDTISLRFMDIGTSKTGKLMAADGKTRYIDGHYWRDLGDDDMQHISDGDDEENEGKQGFLGLPGTRTSDPFTAMFLGSPQISLLQYHPSSAEAIILWETHVQNVEPICKILHIPSTFQMFNTIWSEPEKASRAEECLLFSVYHFAVFSMTEAECEKLFTQSRAILMGKYHFATRQALVNASFLKTTEMSILQALVLFLLSCRHFYEPHTYWILTGVATRIAQRMGVHRDGEKMGLLPFEVQMRRRLFYQLGPLDAMASQMAGTGIAISPDSWDTQLPYNINDDQIWPNMTEQPEERKVATEMIFCLARSCVGKYFAKAGASMQGAGASTANFKSNRDVEEVILQAESEVEEKYIRYCDIVNPLHFLAAGLARAAITAMRIRVRLPKIRNKTATLAEQRDLFELSQKIMDTDTAAYAHANLTKYRWYVKSLFVWGSWDSLIFVLSSLRKSDLLRRFEVDSAWGKVAQFYNNHSELLQSKQALQTAIGRLALKAWNANPPSSMETEPEFIKSLSSSRKMKTKSNSKCEEDSNASLQDTIATEAISGTTAPSHFADRYTLPSDIGNMGFNVGHDFDTEIENWMFWDQLIQGYQPQLD